MLQVPTVWAPTSGSSKKIAQHHNPMALPHLGHGHTRPFPTHKETSKFPNRGRQKLHQLDRRRAISHHNSPTGTKVLLEKHHLSPRIPALPSY